VDFYDKGNFPGSVFQVAATMNNVTYKGHCCGSVGSGAAERLLTSVHVLISVGVVFLSPWL
jgi:hypothetical protein